MELVVNTIGADGNSLSECSSAPLQGGVAGFVEGERPLGMTVTMKVVDAMTRERTATRDGKVGAAVRFALSKDGKVVTVRLISLINRGSRPVKVVRLPSYAAVQYRRSIVD